MSTSDAAGVSGSTIGAIGDIYSGNSKASALNTQATLNQENAQLATEQGQFNAMRVGMTAAQKMGTASAAYGASGVAANSGSVLDVLNTGAINSEMDVQNTLHGAAVKATAYENDASMEQLGASQAQTAGYLNALSSITMGAGNAFGESSSTASDAAESDGEGDEADGASDEAGGEDAAVSGSADDAALAAL